MYRWKDLLNLNLVVAFLVVPDDVENVARKRNVKKDAGVVRNSLLRPPDFSFLILHFFFHLCSNFKELNKENEMGDWLILKVATVNLILIKITQCHYLVIVFLKN